MSMLKHMETCGMGALSPDDEGDDRKEDVGAPKDRMMITTMKSQDKYV